MVVGPKQIPNVKEPQAAVDDEGNIFVVYGSGENIYCSKSDDKGHTFADPIKVATASKLMLGMRRGPRVAISHGTVVVSAISDGNLMCWTSSSNGQRFSDAPLQTLPLRIRCG